ncbi:MAG: alternative ribosome rescue aminoacyl-tRNA hydrolase ArfB [Chryseolinea sp.]
MSQRLVKSALLAPELYFSASRSNGPGGQNVNKVSTKITLRFDVKNSLILDEEEKQRLIAKLKNRVTKDGVLVLSEQGSRSQLQNKEVVVAKFDELLEKAFEPDIIRKKTKRSKASKEKRMKSKRLTSEKKQWRQGM